MHKVTAFCQDVSGRGTVWISTLEFLHTASLDDMIRNARAECCFAWYGNEDEENLERVHCLGLAEGDICILHWEDLNDD